MASNGRSGQPDYAGTVLGPRVVPATNERRTTIYNDSDISSGDPPANRSANHYGKFFPRGMRGMLEEIQLYCKGDAAGTVILNVSPQPGISPLYTATLTPGAVWAWLAGAFNVMWNYDSLFAWVSSCNAAVFWGYDTERPRDGHRTVDIGDTYTDLDERPFIRAIMTGQTAGDLPISGIVNTIPIPHVSSVYEYAEEAIVEDVETMIGQVIGAGYVDLVICHVDAANSSHTTSFKFYCDGVLCSAWNLDSMNNRGYVLTTPPVMLVEYDEDGECSMMISKKWEFKRRFEVYAVNTDGAQTVDVNIYPNLLK